MHGNAIQCNQTIVFIAQLISLTFVLNTAQVGTLAGEGHGQETNSPCRWSLSAEFIEIKGMREEREIGSVCLLKAQGTTCHVQRVYTL